MIRMQEYLKNQENTRGISRRSQALEDTIFLKKGYLSSFSTYAATPNNRENGDFVLINSLQSRNLTDARWPEVTPACNLS